MFKKILYTTLLMLPFLSFNPANREVADDWHLKKFESGIAVYTRTAENSKFKELKSVMQLKTSLSSIIALINDFESYPQWVYRCGVSKTLKKNGETDLMHYQTVTAPWPVDSRDLVVEAKLSQDPKTKIVFENITCFPNFIPKVQGFVRITEFKASWTLTPLKNGYVNVEYQLLVNPGGNIPAWLVNLAVVDGPFDTAFNMKDWVMKEKYQKAALSFIKEPE